MGPTGRREPRRSEPPPVHALLRARLPQPKPVTPAASRIYGATKASGQQSTCLALLVTANASGVNELERGADPLGCSEETCHQEQGKDTRSPWLKGWLAAWGALGPSSWLGVVLDRVRHLVLLGNKSLARTSPEEKPTLSCSHCRCPALVSIPAAC